MNRLHVPASALGGPDVTVTGAAASYLHAVLRLRPGEPLEIFDGEGHVYASRIVRYDGDDAVLAVGPREDRPFGGVRVTLAQGLPKGDKFELIIQKAVELGVTGIVPVACERSVVRLDPKKATERVARWQKIADEAARQCGRAQMAAIDAVQPFAAFVQRPRQAGEKRLLLDEEERTHRLREELTDPTAHHVLLVGPEGGLSRDEVVTAKRFGFVPITLGPRILRTETVGLAVLSIAQHVLGDLG